LAVRVPKSKEGVAKLMKCPSAWPAAAFRKRRVTASREAMLNVTVVI
jgi:hypothetical protein